MALEERTPRVFVWSPVEKNGPGDNENPRVIEKACLVLAYHLKQVQIPDN